MKKTIDDININYEIQGNGPSILLLHGWGSNQKVFNILVNHLKVNHQVITLDLPGFGESSEPSTSWNVSDYSNFVMDFINELKINELTLMGHSFGGRIIIKLMSTNKKFIVNKIVLFDSAGIKKESKASFKTKVFKKISKVIKNENIKNKIKSKIGSPDYKAASPLMREVLVKVVNEDLTPLLKNIDVPTLLIWGENDLDTPYSDAIKMNELISNSGIVKVENAGHYSFLDNPILVNKVLDSFLKEGDK